MHFISREEAESLALRSASSSEALNSARPATTTRRHPDRAGSDGLGQAKRSTLSKRERHRQPGFRLEACTRSGVVQAANGVDAGGARPKLPAAKAVLAPLPRSGRSAMPPPGDTWEQPA